MPHVGYTSPESRCRETGTTFIICQVRSNDMLHSVCKYW